eukprot:CAMPEP_0116843798 /NCGR_PEP_ID=MMETSP0418-20121206/12298_1 /TAXON_ID=1158023 /ORGANISM="Astrosyne radiata, Strain 13vi08-1A" /LENGTH=255 /DNA_ID=CAMNT_0004474611 /DNA_START=75 /DNA_END=842 /DNA_ORIENTATION=-
METTNITITSLGDESSSRIQIRRQPPRDINTSPLRSAHDKKNKKASSSATPKKDAGVLPCFVKSHSDSSVISSIYPHRRRKFQRRNSQTAKMLLANPLQDQSGSGSSSSSSIVFQEPRRRNSDLTFPSFSTTLATNLSVGDYIHLPSPTLSNKGSSSPASSSGIKLTRAEAAEAMRSAKESCAKELLSTEDVEEGATWRMYLAATGSGELPPKKRRQSVPWSHSYEEQSPPHTKKRKTTQAVQVAQGPTTGTTRS